VEIISPGIKNELFPLKWSVEHRFKPILVRESKLEPEQYVSSPVFCYKQFIYTINPVYKLKESREEKRGIRGKGIIKMNKVNCTIDRICKSFLVEKAIILQNELK